MSHGRRILWRGGFTQLDSPTLTTLHNALQSQFGLTPVGAPVYRTFGSQGKLASALYEQAHFLLRSDSDTVTIEALVWGNFNWAEIKTLVKQTLGLKSITNDSGTTYVTVVEDTAEL